MDKDYYEHLAEIFKNAPTFNPKNYAFTKRGIEVTELLLRHEEQQFSWRRSDPDAFWIDVQLMVKFKLSDEEILFMADVQPGINQYKLHKEERDAYRGLIRAFDKLKEINKDKLFTEKGKKLDPRFNKEYKEYTKADVDKWLIKMAKQGKEIKWATKIKKH